jgi:hypothetical protein
VNEKEYREKKRVAVLDYQEKNPSTAPGVVEPPKEEKPALSDFERWERGDITTEQYLRTISLHNEDL